jgi:hypothetical protein
MPLVQNIRQAMAMPTFVIPTLIAVFFGIFVVTMAKPQGR